MKPLSFTFPSTTQQHDIYKQQSKNEKCVNTVRAASSQYSQEIERYHFVT